MSISQELLSASRVAIRQCMNTQLNEKVLIVTDEPMRQIAQALWSAAKEISKEVLLIEMIPRQSNGEEPPAHIAELMKQMDVVLCPTSKSLTHTDARRNACTCGARIATLPDVTEEIMIRCMNADYLVIAERTKQICKLMEKTGIIKIIAPAGTDVRLSVKGRTSHASSGLFHEKGQWGNLPTGEAYLAPLENCSDGIVVVDGSMAGIGMIGEPISISVEKGYAVQIKGGKEAEKLIRLLEPHGKDAYAVAEFGIGTNDKAILSGKIIEDEKVMGTIHIAFGDNKSMGGNVRVASHLDGLIKQPTVWFDDTLVLKGGKLLI
jgi:leucyl aminopeptidase (aminopeptidase T)